MTVALKVEQERNELMLGASEAPAALGMDPHSSPIVPWRRLRGLPVDDNRSEAVREAAEWGNALEPIVRGRYALARNTIIVVPRTSIDMDGWLRATPDGIVWDFPGYEGAPGVTELDVNLMIPKPRFSGLMQVKTCSPFAWRAWGEKPPQKHIVQCVVEMAVCGLPWDDLTYLIGGQHMEVHRIERERERERAILVALRAFWDMVQAGHEPNPDATQAWRDHVASKMRPSKVVAKADEETLLLVSQWREMRFARELAKANEETIKGRLLRTLADAGATALDCDVLGTVTAREVRGRVDYKALAKSLGAKDADEEKFRKPGSSWSLWAPREWSDDED